MIVRHAMARQPFRVQPDDLCLDVLREFHRRGVRHAPVVDGERLVGVVSERDLLRALPRLVGAADSIEGKRDAETRVRSVMSTRPRTCTPNTGLDVAAHRMGTHKIGCLPVVQEGRLFGIVTATDVLSAFSSNLAEKGSIALTMMWNGGGSGAPPDVAALCVDHRLQISTLLTSATASGATSYVLRVRGSDRDAEEFVQRAAQRGLLLVQRRKAA